ncbi:uncharacterized protein METZ01_LOCUS364629, partial [marine metagenome]
TSDIAAMRYDCDGDGIEECWIGSLTEWNVLTGYWVNTYFDGDMNTYDVLTFSFVNEGLSRKKQTKLAHGWHDNLPKEFKYIQSVNRAFYFFDNVIVDGADINLGEWILAYNNGIIVGARQWNGEPIDVPVMGYDGYTATAGYCEVGDIPKFKLYRPGSGELINMSGEFSIWTNNLIWYAGTLEGGNTIPNTFRIGNPYPNPFNPVTTITYDVPLDCELELSIFDLQGRLVEKLIAGEVKAGYYEIQWNARMQASGIYFMRMRTPNTTMIRKLVLMK